MAWVGLCEGDVWAAGEISCKNVLWSYSPTSSFNRSSCPTKSISGWIVTTVPWHRAQSYTLLKLTHSWWGWQKSRAFSLSALGKCKSWQMRISTDGGRFTGFEACQEVGFNCDQDIVYSEVYDGLTWGWVCKVEEFVAIVRETWAALQYPGKVFTPLKCFCILSHYKHQLPCILLVFYVTQYNTS